jgi:RNA polymerase sigma-70 factor (ECF subfamily)
VTAMASNREVREGLVKCIPKLRAFAISMTGDKVRADDLVQETLCRAWTNQSQFVPGTNLMAWLYTILRNEFYSTMRRRRHEVEDVEGTYSAMLAVHPNQQSALDFSNLKLALAKLPAEQREALLLIGGEGLSYEEAARICGVRVGTVKSRVNRARGRLEQLLDVTPEQDLGPEARIQAALQESLPLVAPRRPAASIAGE